jgi:hypothetical protein
MLRRTTTMNSRKIFQSKSLHFALAVFTLLTLSAITVIAQTSFGSIVGTVTDKTGATVPDARVTLTNVDTSDQRVAPTSAQGNYTFVNLVPGQYTIEIKKSGFKNLTLAGVTVQVQAAVRSDATLKIGDATQTVTVSSTSPLLDTETSSTVSKVIEGRPVQDMPLNGRNVLNLVALVPGVVPQGSTSGSPVGNQLGGAFTNTFGFGNYQIGGALANQSAFLIDGVSVNLPQNNAVSFVPTQDAIQEFRVSTNNVNAEFGNFAGGVVSLTTKGGTNMFHGNVYEYLRNAALDANNYFNNARGVPRGKFVQNQYGATVGGPVYLFGLQNGHPSIWGGKDKSFFFFSWENYSYRQGIPFVASVPTDAMKEGDFSNPALPQIFDPCGGTVTAGGQGCPAYQGSPTPFAGNQIGSNRIDPTAKAMLYFWPSPNAPGVVNNYVGNQAVGASATQYNVRIDQKLSEKQSLFGHFSYWSSVTTPNDPFHNQTGLPISPQDLQSVLIGDSYTFSPTTVGEFRFSFLRVHYAITPLAEGSSISRFGPAYAALAAANEVGALNPQLNFNGGSVYFQGFQNVAELDYNHTYTASGNITKIANRHTLKFGSAWTLADQTFGLPNGLTAPSFSFSPAAYGIENEFAAFLLGYPSGGSSSREITTTGILRGLGLFAQDAYQVNRKLTLNVGMRWDLQPSWLEKDNNNSVLLTDAPDPLGTIANPVTGQQQQLVGQLAPVGSQQYPDRHASSRPWATFAPRFGLAYRLNEKTVVGAGYGVFFLPPYTAEAVSPYGSTVNSATTTMAATLDGNHPNYTLSNPFPNGITAPPGNNAALYPTLEGGTITSLVPHEPAAYSQQWNLNLQQEIFKDAVFQIAYVGNKGTHLTSGSTNPPLLNINQLPDQFDSLGTDLLTQVANPLYGKLPSTAGSLAGPTILKGYLLKPDPQFQNVNILGPHSGASSYNALQVSAQKRFSSGGTFLAAYTWAKFIANTDTGTNYLDPAGSGVLQDNYNLHAERSLVSFDVPQRLVLSYVLDLPFGDHQRFLNHLGAVGGRIVSGWTVNGITTFQSGTPLAFTATGATASGQNALTQLFGGGTLRPDVVLSAIGCGGQKTTQGSAHSRLNDWFNTACFAQPGRFSFGNESRTDSTLRSHGTNNWDFSLVKSTPINEHLRLLFKAESFNLFNRVQFGSPVTQEGNPSFGQVLTQLNSPRELQFALRFEF